MPTGTSKPKFRVCNKGVVEFPAGTAKVSVCNVVPVLFCNTTVTFPLEAEFRYTFTLLILKASKASKTRP